MQKSGFSKEYWDKNYSELEEMDGVANAKEHARYAQAFFEVEYVEVKSLIDLGFGLGAMFKQFYKAFEPLRAVGIEPSEHAYEEVMNKKWHRDGRVRFHQMDLLAWAQSNKKHLKNFDLGLCTSVFQYLSEEEIDLVLPVLADRLRYLYFSVPTTLELSRQRTELDFHDTYATDRSREWYLKKLEAYFTVISARILESKIFFDDKSTHFTDLLFRF
jgi:trans-aconitate methyltransferase